MNSSSRQIIAVFVGVGAGLGFGYFFGNYFVLVFICLAIALATETTLRTIKNVKAPSEPLKFLKNQDLTSKIKPKKPPKPHF